MILMHDTKSGWTTVSTRSWMSDVACLSFPRISNLTPGTPKTISDCHLDSELQCCWRILSQWCECCTTKHIFVAFGWTSRPFVHSSLNWTTFRRPALAARSGIDRINIRWCSLLLRRLFPRFMLVDFSCVVIIDILISRRPPKSTTTHWDQAVIWRTRGEVPSELSFGIYAICHVLTNCLGQREGATRPRFQTQLVEIMYKLFALPRQQ